MKKSDIAEIINRLTDLEVKMARDIQTQSFQLEEVAFNSFNTLTRITSDLDKIWKGK